MKPLLTILVIISLAITTSAIAASLGTVIFGGGGLANITYWQDVDGDNILRVDGTPIQKVSQ